MATWGGFQALSPGESWYERSKLSRHCSPISFQAAGPDHARGRGGESLASTILLAMPVAGGSGRSWRGDQKNTRQTNSQVRSWRRVNRFFAEQTTKSDQGEGDANQRRILTAPEEGATTDRRSRGCI